MEENKNQVESAGSGSGGSKNPAGNTMNKTAEKILDDVKGFELMSLVGLGIVVVFFLFMFFDVFNLKWWIMLPLAGAGGFLLYRQKSETKGFEKNMCFYGLVALIIFVVGRDINITNQLEFSKPITVQIEKARNMSEDALKNLTK